MAAAALSVDAPHVVYTGAACASCYAVAPGRLHRCSACSHAWYCSRDCQKRHFPQHKALCKALRVFEALQEGLPEECWPRSARDFYVQRVNCHQVLEPMLRRPLSREERRALLAEAKCSVCCRTRGQLLKAVPAAGSVAAPLAAAAAAPGAPGAALECCSACNWGWACQQHRSAYLSGPHAAVCTSYHLMNDVQLTTRSLLSSLGGRIPNYVPDLPAPIGGFCPLPAGGWTDYAAWRPMPSWGPAMEALLSKRWSQALTVVQALAHHYDYHGAATPAATVGTVPVAAEPGAPRTAEPSADVDGSGDEVTAAAEPAAAPSSGSRNACESSRAPLRPLAPPGCALEIHVIGASAFEAPADAVWREVQNLLPGAPAAALHVAFIGPELDEIIHEGLDGCELPQQVAAADHQQAGAAPPPGLLSYTYHACTYQDFHGGGGACSRASEAGACGGGGDGSSHGASARAGGSDGGGGGRRDSHRAWRRPHLAVAFNSGMSESDQPLWQPTLQLLVRQGIPVVFTSYNEAEARADAAAWMAAGGTVTHGPAANPYRVMEPISEPAEVDVFYYQNGFWFCGRGGGGGGASAEG